MERSLSLDAVVLQLQAANLSVKYSEDQPRAENGQFGEGHGTPTHPTTTLNGVKISHPANMRPLSVHPTKKAAMAAGMDIRRNGDGNAFVVTADSQHHFGVTGLTGRQALVYAIGE